jgi:hypothetical protein
MDLDPSFQSPGRVSSPTGSVHLLPVGSDEKDYSLFIDDYFCDLTAVEANKYAAQRQTIKLD